MPFDVKDAEFLLTRPEFRRFLFSAIQSAGILGHTVSASTAPARDLAHLEGRRALGFDLLLMVHAGQSEAVRSADPDGITTLGLSLTEALNSKENHRESRRPATAPDTTSSPATPERAAPVAASGPVAATQDQPVVGGPPASLTPERYELALDGFSVDPALVQNADPVLRDLGLSNDAANKLLPVARDIMARTQDSLVRQIEGAAAAQKKTWHDAFLADPEIGGARRSETEHFAAKALDALGYGQGHPFRQTLDESGFGNHPDMIRAFRRLGELVGEDGSFVRPTTASNRNRPVWERLYPNEAR